MSTPTVIDPYLEARQKRREAMQPWDHRPRIGSTRFQRLGKSPGYTPGYGDSATGNRPGYGINPFGGPMDVFGGRELKFLPARDRQRAMDGRTVVPFSAPQPATVPPPAAMPAPEMKAQEVPEMRAQEVPADATPPPPPPAPAPSPGSAGLQPFASVMSGTSGATPEDIRNYVSAYPDDNVQFRLPNGTIAKRTVTPPAVARPGNWQDDIMAKHPAIGVAGSPENLAFVQQFKAGGSDPSTAMQLADSIMAPTPNVILRSPPMAATSPEFINPYN